jgi:hypothetical protein
MAKYHNANLLNFKAINSKNYIDPSATRSTKIIGKDVLVEAVGGIVDFDTTPIIEALKVKGITDPVSPFDKDIERLYGINDLLPLNKAGVVAGNEVFDDRINFPDFVAKITYLADDGVNLVGFNTSSRSLEVWDKAGVLLRKKIVPASEMPFNSWKKLFANQTYIVLGHTNQIAVFDYVTLEFVKFQSIARAFEARSWDEYDNKIWGTWGVGAANNGVWKFDLLTLEYSERDFSTGQPGAINYANNVAVNDYGVFICAGTGIYQYNHSMTTLVSSYTGATNYVHIVAEKGFSTTGKNMVMAFRTTSPYVLKFLNVTASGLGTVTAETSSAGSITNTQIWETFVSSQGAPIAYSRTAFGRNMTGSAGSSTSNSYLLNACPQKAARTSIYSPYLASAVWQQWTFNTTTASAISQGSAIFTLPATSVSWKYSTRNKNLLIGLISGQNKFYFVNLSTKNVQQISYTGSTGFGIYNNIVEFNEQYVWTVNNGNTLQKRPLATPDTVSLTWEYNDPDNYNAETFSVMSFAASINSNHIVAVYNIGGQSYYYSGAVFEFINLDDMSTNIRQDSYNYLYSQPEEMVFGYNGGYFKLGLYVSYTFYQFDGYSLSQLYDYPSTYTSTRMAAFEPSANNIIILYNIERNYSPSAYDYSNYRYYSWTITAAFKFLMSIYDSQDNVLLNYNTNTVWLGVHPRNMYEIDKSYVIESFGAVSLYKINFNSFKILELREVS